MDNPADNGAETTNDMSSPQGLDGQRDARRRLAGAIRRLASAAVLTTADDEVIDRALAAIGMAADELANSARSSRYEGTAGLVPGSPANAAVWETHATFGQSNPLAPPVIVDEGSGRLDGSVTFGGAWEGGPGTVYGGFLASVFDGMLGRAALAAGHLGVTRTLTVRFVKPTPVHTALHVESQAGQVTGRDMAVWGGISLDGVTTAEAEAVFTSVDPTRYRR